MCVRVRQGQWGRADGDVLRNCASPSLPPWTRGRATERGRAPGLPPGEQLPGNCSFLHLTASVGSPLVGEAGPRGEQLDRGQKYMLGPARGAQW